MEPLASPIQIDVRPLPRLERAVDVLHACVLVSLLACFPVSALSAVAACGVISSWIIQYRRRLDLARRARALLLRSNGNWSLVSPAGEIIGAELVGSPFVSVAAIVLTLKPRRQADLRIVLSAANTSPNALRRLRVLLLLPIESASR